jgi:ribonucleoside-diphosphate reductase alpha chain
MWMNNIDTKDQFGQVIRDVVPFLMCGGMYSHIPIEKIREVGLKNNRIGLGLGGMHEWLMVRGNGYHVTPELHKWLNVYEQESDSSAYITAKELDVAIPLGKRAIAPTGTIGILAETTTGIEPLFCKAYKRRYLKDEKWKHQYVVDGTVKRLIDKGVKVEDIKDSFDITFKERVKFQADVQNYVDMAISSTCNLPKWGSEGNNEETLKKDSKVLLKYAKRLRGFTCYPDGSRGGQPLTRVTLDEALSKEGQVFEEHVDECAGGICGL